SSNQSQPRRLRARQCAHQHHRRILEFGEARFRWCVPLGEQEIFANLSQRVFFPVQPPRLREFDFPVACREGFATGVVEAFLTSEKKSSRVNGRESPGAFLAEGLG